MACFAHMKNSADQASSYSKTWQDYVKRADGWRECRWQRPSRILEQWDCVNVLRLQRNWCWKRNTKLNASETRLGLSDDCCRSVSGPRNWIPVMPRGVYHRTAAALANVKKAAKGQDRRIKISAARKEYWATRTLDQIVAFKKMRSELANTQWHNITDTQRTARRLAARKTRESRSPEYQALLNSAWAEKSRQSWADMTLADKRERVIKQAPTRKDYTLIDGSIAGFHSSWE